MRSPEPLESLLPFAVARDNFYAAARHGLAAEVCWLGGACGSLGELLSTRLLDTAARGLEQAGLAAAEVRRWLDPMRARVSQRMTGAARS